MRITVAGTGYVGLVTGVCFAGTGNHVVGYDVDGEKISRLAQGQCPLFEPGLAEMLRANLDARRIRFTTDRQQAIAHGQAIFVAIGTPSRQDGGADVGAIEEFARQVARVATGPKILVLKSTVPVGTGARLEAMLAGQGKQHISVVSNPEFLKEGSAVDDFLRPDRVVIGAEDPQAGEVVRQLYLPFVRNQRPVLVMSRNAAELTKYAANAFLATRISFINEIAYLCERFGVDVNEVRLGMATDARIGFQFLYPGIGYGGSCFPKDIRALCHIASNDESDGGLFDAVNRINKRQGKALFQKICKRFSGLVGDMTFAIWGVSFKPNTDDIREAPALALIDDLLNMGAQVRAHDPQALDNLRAVYGEKLSYYPDAYQALDGADAMIICTEWNEFRSPDLERIAQLLKHPMVFDGRNLYEPAAMNRAGFEYYSIGRPDAGG